MNTVKKTTKKLSEDTKRCARLEYLLARRELELEDTKNKLKGEREVNSLCAAFIMHLLLLKATRDKNVLRASVNKDELNAQVNKYFAACEDGGDCYNIVFCERSASKDNESEKKAK